MIISENITIEIYPALGSLKNVNVIKIMNIIIKT